ncbi:hypothetical protein Pla123a_40430 [Posidoniimonas polymericola]|uniref:3-keto-alpha-glucoside-1,2-lyase/3-keto-2-hydroxy-glucal hydratase domain-containing protein n=1 Tax=Posidoniimonas polymericola TaxID=2528002 RepID=A0A5C5YCB5_9BACT|nr:DUF1080 domain-containing protein [Posidoniimonas polymericola]TWT72744.1 hypothetical protein Pla123a_40430 [Posidoniimonas polymericola]
MQAYRNLVLTVLATLVLVPFAAADELPSAFNGQDLSGWKTKEAENLWWSADDGVLSVKNDPKQQPSILWTEQSYGDFVMQIEFRFGEGNVDSGVFVRNETDQIQIGISGSLKRDMTCSPYIAGKGYPVEAERISELLKQDDWNAMTLVAVGSRYDVWLNGAHVMSYESDTADKTGPIGLQLHAQREMAIDFRNIRIAELD